MSPSQPLKVRYRSQKRLTRNARFASRTVTAKKIWHLCSGCYRFFLFLSRHVVCAVECLDRAQGLGTRFRPLLQTHVACMQRATSDMFAWAQTLAEDAADCDTDVVGTVCMYVGKYLAVQYY
jgi:hypothetical protein